jgi:predicted RNA methylase
MTNMSQKERGAYYTPDLVVASLVHWVIRSRKCRLIDPACGDGRFIALHGNSVGIELDRDAVNAAKMRAPECRIHQRDFFAWAEGTKERFDCAAGNPPFIRYQTFSGETRERALRLCKRRGEQQKIDQHG